MNNESEFINPIGVMQGRLSTPVNGMIQAFPRDHWRDEFRIAGEIGLDALEFIFDGPDSPLLDPTGAQEIRDLADDNGIVVSSISTDYTMFCPLFGNTKSSTLKWMHSLIDSCAGIGIPRVGISFEDNSAILTEEHGNQAIDSMQELTKHAEQTEIILTVEALLFDGNLRCFFERVGSPNLRVNFDTGNSCAYGEHPAEVIRDLRDLIGGVHIKDRPRLFGMTKPLGTGDTDLKGSIEALQDIGYGGPLILQAARNGEDDVATVKGYMELVRSMFKVKAAG